MSETIIVAILSCLGTAAGSIVSILTANRITNYKIEKLEEEVRKHNGLIDRMYRVEGRCDVLQEKIEDLEGKKK